MHEEFKKPKHERNETQPLYFKLPSEFAFGCNDTPEEKKPLSYYVGPHMTSIALNVVFGGFVDNSDSILRNNPFVVLYNTVEKYYCPRDIRTGINQYLDMQGPPFSKKTFTGNSSSYSTRSVWVNR